MKIEVNKDAKNNRIQELFNTCVKEITSNAQNGIEETDLYLPIDFSSDVRDKLIKEIENIRFLTISTGRNEFTGRHESYASETVNGMRRYKVRLY
jgi:hypothetical protein